MSCADDGKIVMFVESEVLSVECFVNQTQLLAAEWDVRAIGRSVSTVPQSSSK
jgi:hypothetical protein